ncbi:recombinase family protein [Clostridium perfringens]|uniref:recombinase family protein n=1 Tax=Clostridium perfringens TaxID=1502 RepID=UPI00096A9946|nr:recombinase family protein [Clostridium perfringens]
MKNIAIYIRKSVKGDDNSISLEAQTEVIKNYFKEKCNFTIYKDDGFSGGNTNRPAFKQLMSDSAMNKFDAVACYKLDRIARNTLDFLTTFNTLKEYGVDLICVEDKYDPSTPAGRMMMTLLASLAEIERENIKQRVKDSMIKLAREGRWTGGTAPFGYRIININGGKYLELVDEDNIKYIFNEFVNGKGILKLSREFNCNKQNISRVLHSITYLQSSIEANKYLDKVLNYEVVGTPNGCGYLPYGNYKNVNGRKVKNTGNKLATVSKHKAVIDLDTFIKAQNRLKTFEGNPAPRISSKSFLAQMVECRCGSNMLIALGRKRKDGSRKNYFYCPNKCGNKMIDIEKLEKDVFIILKDINFLDYDFKYSFTTPTKDYSKIKEPLLKEISAKKKILDGLVNKLALVDENLTNILINKMESLNSEINELQEKLNELEKEEISSSYSEEDLVLKENSRKNFIKEFNKMDMKERQATIKSVLNKVLWTGDNIFIK